MPSKSVFVREYKVRAHERTIHARRYLFICKQCNQASERESYGPRPIYCQTCRPPVSHSDATSKKKKKPRPILALEAKSSQAIDSYSYPVRF